MAIGVLIVLVLVAAWIATVVNIIRTPEGTFRAGSQIPWVLLVVLAPFIGVPLYWILAAPQRPRT
jgi:phospholipase D-like protein